MTPTEEPALPELPGAYVDRARAATRQLQELDDVQRRYVLSGLAWRQLDFAEQLLAEAAQLYGDDQRRPH